MPTKMKTRRSLIGQPLECLTEGTLAKYQPKSFGKLNMLENMREYENINFNFQVGGQNLWPDEAEL